MFLNSFHICIITGRNEVLAKVIFSQASVIHSVHRGGGVWSGVTPGGVPGQAPPLHGRHPPSRQAPPLAGTPPGRHPPLAGTPPGRHPPLLPGRHPPPGQAPPPPWQAPPPRQAPPPLAGTPPRQAPPPGRHPPPDTVNARPVRILLECILVTIKILQVSFFCH